MTDKQQASEKRWNPRIPPALAIVIIVGAIAGVVYLIWGYKTQSDRAWHQTEASIAGRTYVEAGSETKLTTGLVAADQRTLRDAIEAVRTDDKTSFEALYISGRIFRVPKQTRVLILQNSNNESKVRILEGKYNGIEGWISDDWLR